MSLETFHLDLRAGVRQHLLAMAGVPAVSWEGKGYSPKVGTPYITEVLQPIASEHRGGNVAGYQVHTVDSLLTLHYPADKGTLDIEGMAGKLLNHFRPGSAIVYQTASVHVHEVERGPLRQDTDWVHCTVSITMIGHTSN